MPLYRILERGQAPRRAWIQLLRSLTPMTVAEIVAVLEGEGEFAVNPSVVDPTPALEPDIEAFGAKYGASFEQRGLVELPDYPGPNLGELEGWAERGFELHISVRYFGGANEAVAMWPFNRVLGIDFAHALDMVQYGQAPPHRLNVAQARALFEAMREHGGRVRFELQANEVAYALELGGRGQGRWQGLGQVERARALGPELVVERGPLSGLAWERVEARVFPDPPSLAQAFEGWREQARERGLQVFESGLELLAASSERNWELEAELRAASDPSAALAVHCDWLQSRGDPRAELALAQLSGDEVRARELIEAQASALFGPLALALDDDKVRAWAGGFVHELRLSFGDRGRAQGHRHLLGLSALELAQAALELPCCAGLRSLQLDGSQRGLEFAQLFTAPALAGLRRLELRASRYGTTRISSWEGLERLEELRLDSTFESFAPPSLPSLRVLELGRAYMFDPSKLAASELPRLEQVVVEFHEAIRQDIGRDLAWLPPRPISRLRLRELGVDQAGAVFTQLRAHAKQLQLERVELEHEGEDVCRQLAATGRLQLGDIVHIVEFGAPLV